MTYHQQQIISIQLIYNLMSTKLQKSYEPFLEDVKDGYYSKESDLDSLEDFLGRKNDMTSDLLAEVKEVREYTEELERDQKSSLYLMTYVPYGDTYVQSTW